METFHLKHPKVFPEKRCLTLTNYIFFFFFQQIKQQHSYLLFTLTEITHSILDAFI